MKFLLPSFGSAKPVPDLCGRARIGMESIDKNRIPYPAGFEAETAEILYTKTFHTENPRRPIKGMGSFGYIKLSPFSSAKTAESEDNWRPKRYNTRVPEA